MVFKSFRVIAWCDLDISSLAPKSNQHIYEHKCIRDQNWVKFASFVYGFFDMVFTSFPGLTDSPTDGRTQNRMPPTPKVFCG